jgi:5-methylcytosine-specific restriction endonuclease McrA
MRSLSITEEQIRNSIKNSGSMAEAAKVLTISFSSFKRYARKYKLYNPNQGGKGLPGEVPSTKILLDEILQGKHPAYQTNKLRIRLIKEGKKLPQCEKCGLDEWQGQIIPLELHHFDGNKRNHKIRNLQMLCPNCHAQTDTYCGKNIKRPSGEIGRTR